MIAKERLSLLMARAALAASALAFVAAAGLPFWAGWPERATPPPAIQPEAAMSEYYSDRNALREAELSELRAIAQSPLTSDELREAAQTRLMALRDWMDQEAAVEAVLAARGYPPVLATVRAGSVNAVLSAPLTQAEAAVLLELIARETGVEGKNIKLVAING